MDKVPIGVRRILPTAKLPEYKTKQAAGMDLAAAEAITIHPTETAMIRTGLCFQIPEGYELQIRPRSGLSLQTGLRIENSPGTIDSDYRGEVLVLMQNTGAATFVMLPGDRIAQLVLAKIPRAYLYDIAELEETERGSGGVGHTGIREENK